MVSSKRHGGLRFLFLLVTALYGECWGNPFSPEQLTGY